MYVKILLFAIIFLHASDIGAFETEGPDRVLLKPLETASVIIRAKDMVLEANTISFVIPENAATQERNADSVMVSAVSLKDREAGDLCPFLSSIYVKKDIDSYNPFTGRARVTATFSDEWLAQTTAESGCLLINDID
jgi:hypothetical protein